MTTPWYVSPKPCPESIRESHGTRTLHVFSWSQKMCACGLSLHDAQGLICFAKDDSPTLAEWDAYCEPISRDASALTWLI